MSNAFLMGTSGGGGGTGILTITGNSGGAVGADLSDNIFVVGGSSTANNNNGLATAGNPGTNTETINLTNRISNAVTTMDDSLTTLASFSLGSTAAVFSFNIEIVSFNMSDINGDSYAIFGAARTDGTTAVVCGIPDKIVNEEVMDDADANMIVSGNNLIIQVKGLIGKTFHWRTVATYVQVT